jgi:DNA-binding beta-propeller fold protein YncE
VLLAYKIPHKVPGGTRKALPHIADLSKLKGVEAMQNASQVAVNPATSSGGRHPPSAIASTGKAALHYEIDPWWPKPLPGRWVFGQLAGVSVDRDDTVVVVNRQDITDEEAETSENAPPIVVFDAEGNVVKTWGDINVLPIKPERCIVDYEHNVWIPGQKDGLLHKYSWDGELLLAIGKRGSFDSSDGTIKGKPLNAAKDLFFQPTSVAVDPTNNDFYVTDGYGNRRVVVFDRNGNFLRQWGRQATPEEMEEGVGGVFAQVVHDVVISNEGLVYVCDRQGDRIQVFDKMGNFKRNIWARTGTERLPDPRGTAWTMVFSPDPEQKLIYLMNGRNEQVHIIDHATGEILSTFGRAGHQLGAFTHGHTIAIDSKSNLYVSETHTGRRVQRFKPV